MQFHPILTLLTLTTMLSLLPHTHSYPASITNISRTIEQLTRQTPAYTITKLSYTNLTRSLSSPVQQCLASQHGHKYELIPSINIHEGDSASYPAIVRYCDEYYTLAGYHLLGLGGWRYFLSSVKNQFTYFIQVDPKAGGDTTLLVNKLRNKNKKVLLEEQARLEVPLKYGQICSVANSFSLSLRLFAVATIRNYILFYRLDGKLQSQIDLNPPQPLFPSAAATPGPIKLTKLNNFLAIHTTSLSPDAFLYTISTSGKNSTLKKYSLPKFTASLAAEMELKYNDQHWNQFYVKVGDRVYVYDQAQTGVTEIGPKYWYSLLTPHDRFHVAGSMLIVESDRPTGKGEPIRIYYNLTSGSIAQFLIPQTFCPYATTISTASQSQGSQILCTFCGPSYQCYSLSSSSTPSESSSDYSDYSKFRVPLVLLSLGIVIFISVTRSKNRAGKSLDEQKEEDLFMKELEKKDKNLYEQLKRSRKEGPGGNQARARSAPMDPDQDDE